MVTQSDQLGDKEPIIYLSADDQRALAAAILNPPAPSSALLRAAEAHRRLCFDNGDTAAAAQCLSPQ